MYKTKHFSLLTAEDLMSTDLVLIPQDMTLRGAAHLLSAGQVSGAPVVDQDSRCVGVLSATDFLHWADTTGFKPTRDAICCPWEIIEPASLPQDVVRNAMTRDPVMVQRQTTVIDIARRMIDAHIHRVIVVDDAGVPEGVVSSIDILAAVAYSAASDRAASRCDAESTSPDARAAPHRVDEKLDLMHACEPPMARCRVSAQHRQPGR